MAVNGRVLHVEDPEAAAAPYCNKQNRSKLSSYQRSCQENGRLVMHKSRALWKIGRKCNLQNCRLAHRKLHRERVYLKFNSMAMMSGKLKKKAHRKTAGTRTRLLTCRTRERDICL